MASEENQPKRKPGHNKETIIAAIRECTEKLGYVPTAAEVCSASKIHPSTIRRLFGTYGFALRAAGLEKLGSGHPIPMDALFKDWAQVVRKLGKIPSLIDYGMNSQFSARPLADRFERWTNVPEGLMLWAQGRGLEGEWQDVFDAIKAQLKARGRAAQTSAPPSPPTSAPTLMNDRPVFGMSLMPIPMAHAPMNENGVLCLFGMLAEDLGFVVLRIQQEFPDCKAMRRIDKKHWQEVWIEFEFESRNFLAHMHNVEGCDLIVCWEHNWPECPLEVVELKSKIGRSGHREIGISKESTRPHDGCKRG